MIRQFHYKVLDSTNPMAKRLWRNMTGSLTPLAVIAETQTAGEARKGQTWPSPKGGLWFTLIWPAPKPGDYYQTLPLAAGGAVAEAIIKTTGLPCRIKWPGDILINGNKVAGLTCEMDQKIRPRCLVIGVGINANFSSNQLGGDFNFPMTTLQDQLGEPVDLNELKQNVLEQLQFRLSRYDRQGMRKMADWITPLLAWVGETVKGQSDEEEHPVIGRLEGLDDRGRLLLRVEGKLKPFGSGEVDLVENNGH